ncbi:MAG: PAS domain S-box protein [Mucilaginibacter sp.]
MLTDFSVLFDHNPNPMWIYEIPSLRILKVNNAAITSYGYTEKEFLGMAISDIRPRFNLAKFNEYLITKTADEQRDEFVYAGVWKHQNKQGNPIYAEISGRKMNCPDYDCRIIIATDVTEKIKSQEDAKIREQFLNSLIDSQTNFLIRIATNGNLTFINRQFLKVFGFKANELVGKHFSAITISEELVKCEIAFQECLTQPGKVIKLTHKKRDKGGNIHDTKWEFISVTNDEGDVTEIQGIGQDITHEKMAEREITLTRNNLEGLIDNTDDLVWSIDRDGRYLYINKAFKEVLRAQTGVVPQTGKKPFSEALVKAYNQETVNEWQLYYDRALKGEKYYITKETINPLTQQAVYYETHFNPIYTAEGEIIGVGCFSRNITERLKAANSLIEQNNRLKHIATLSSHDLRRPVASMLGLITVLDKDNFSNPANKEIIDHLFTVSTEIDTVIHQIVDRTFITDLNIE